MSHSPIAAQDLPRAFFSAPDWGAPLNAARLIAAIPDDAVIAGMFLQAIVLEAKRRHVPLPSARERYVPFGFYPQREHATLLVEASAAFYAERPIRAALRSLGRAAPKALATSTVGKVVVGCEDGVHEIIAAFSRTYAINVRPSQANVVETGPNQCIVRLERV
ncbi:MAG TPA: DUF2378 family protein, partial [Polyangiaceae bacterium]|nr:DUF2378 family protein [Polyangiaceae bacterium]